MRVYSELSRLETFEERFEYLKLGGAVGGSTFGFDRYLNQRFYSSREWKSTRDYVIVRDHGCDLGVRGFEIYGELLVHHMNPVQVDDIVHQEAWILEPEYLITTTQRTHNAIHFGTKRLLPKLALERTPGDTKLW
jgi:hypothetical protein